MAVMIEDIQMIIDSSEASVPTIMVRLNGEIYNLSDDDWWVDDDGDLVFELDKINE